MALAVVQEVQCGVLYFTCFTVGVLFYVYVIEEPLAISPSVGPGLGQEDSRSTC